MSDLDALAAGLQAAADGALSSAVAEAMAEHGNELLAQEFATSTAPSGAPWAPAARDYGHPLLVASGDLEGSGSCEVGPRDDAAGFDLTFKFTDEKALWHNSGTSRSGRVPSGTRRKSGADGSAERQHIPARPLLPAAGDDGKWRDELDAVGQTAADKWLASNVRA